MIEYVLPIVYTSQAYQSKIRQGSLSVPSCPPKWTLLCSGVGKKFKKLCFQAVKHSVVSVQYVHCTFIRKKIKDGF